MRAAVAMRMPARSNASLRGRGSRTAVSIAQIAPRQRGYAAFSLIVKDEYVISGARVATPATTSDKRRESAKRAILYVGKTESDISTAFTIFIKPYAVWGDAP